MIAHEKSQYPVQVFSCVKAADDQFFLLLIRVYTQGTRWCSQTEYFKYEER